MGSALTIDQSRVFLVLLEQHGPEQSLSLSERVEYGGEEGGFVVAVVGSLMLTV